MEKINTIERKENELFLAKLRKLCIEYDTVRYGTGFEALSVYSFCESKLLGTDGLQKSWILPENPNS